MQKNGVIFAEMLVNGFPFPFHHSKTNQKCIESLNLESAELKKMQV